MTLSTLFVVSIVVWISVGVIWLLPKKLKLMQRLGHLTADQIIQLGKAGDTEVLSLRRKGWWWFAVGLAVIVPMQIALQVIKLKGG